MTSTIEHDIPPYRRTAAAAAGMLLALAPCLAAAQSAADAERYPAKPIRVIVPSTPGGGNDILTRLIGAKLSERWGQQVVADLRPGAGGIIGSELAAQAPPDGYTLLIVAGGYALNTLLYASLPYDTFRDFERVTVLAFAPNVMVVHPSLPARSLKAFVALAKAKPGALAYASSGVGTSSYLSAEVLIRMAGLSMVHVPYKGAGASSTAVLVGEVPMVITAPGTSVQHFKSGRLIPLGVTSPKRMGILPDVPAIAELYPGYDVQNFYGIVAPAKTPRAIIDKLHAEIVRILQLPDVRERYATLGFEAGGIAPEESTAHAKAEIGRWRKIFAELGIKPQ
jgi:tripartite-type tricarboxylate transporter receptor subunit TctC